MDEYPYDDDLIARVALPKINRQIKAKEDGIGIFMYFRRFSIIQLLTIVIFMLNGQFLTGKNKAYEEHILIGAIILLIHNLIQLFFIEKIMELTKSNNLTVAIISIIITGLMLFAISYDISATVFFFDSNNFTIVGNNLFRILIVVMSLLLSCLWSFIVITSIVIGMFFAWQNRL